MAAAFFKLLCHVNLSVIAGGSGPLIVMSPLPTKLLMSWEDVGTDHPDVPANFYFLVMGSG